MSKPYRFLPSQQEIQACWELGRFHNNIGFWVVWLPTVWSLAMVYHANRNITFIDVLWRAIAYIPMCFGVKSLIMTVDDLLDNDVDLLVERTKNRAIPRGAITISRAWMFFALQAVIGICWAFKALSPTALRTSMLVWPLYVIYPTCKRWTYCAPIPLGLMFNVGIFMGWSDLSENDIHWATLVPLYLGSTLWTICYETIYQHQDRDDDIKIGIYSMALLFGRATIPICGAAAAGFFSLFCYSAFLNSHGYAFFLSVAVAATVTAVRLLRTDIDVPQDCRDFFLGSTHVSCILACGLVVDGVVARLMSGGSI
ncbi:UbiA prenyltransferase [Stereum hirsutum FP-91666 SS1]|uniref:UbiA prenyltransferase n=1 Tax=Stereum hirsutum (strain FP-91666) TaxID=721885 RepID=UPI000440B641|nr:UbiA prenyltransferase [Stereum hirsutum FP-91666 SS1]EIM90617.1 UbiA prenyltransferase [Stereum hirsutum FP-91666 SS1]